MILFSKPIDELLSVTEKLTLFQVRTGVGTPIASQLRYT